MTKDVKKIRREKKVERERERESKTKLKGVQEVVAVRRFSHFIAPLTCSNMKANSTPSLGMLSTSRKQ